MYFGLFGEHIGKKTLNEIEGKDRAPLFGEHRRLYSSTGTYPVNKNHHMNLFLTIFFIYKNLFSIINLSLCLYLVLKKFIQK